jgi:hypothetical protein
MSVGTNCNCNFVISSLGGKIAFIQKPASNLLNIKVLAFKNI